ncbi:MAG: alpha/beta fold hydrolase [Proteobacteria bacterium]|nr:alpha/beta fold hydrolase [Pseudomonadota bacterium]
MLSKELYPFNPKQISIHGHSLSYIDEGEGSAVVMLHGNPTWSFYYRNLALFLKSSHRVIVPDHMGCGLSDKPQDYPYTLKTHIDNLEFLLNELNLERITLVVHDWGGAIGMGYAVRHPEHIDKLVVLNTAAFRSTHIPFRISICRWPVIGPLIVRGLNGFALPAVSMAVTRKMAPDVAAGYLAPYESWSNRIAILRFVQDIPLSSSHPSWDTLVEVEQGLVKLKDKPMLILWGGRDFCFTRHFYEEWLKRFPKAVSHFFDDAGHYVLEDAADLILPEINKFL